MAYSNRELKDILFGVVEQFAQRWNYEKVKKLKDDVEDHLYSDCEPEDSKFWQSHITFLELNTDDKGDYAMLGVDISDNRKGGILKKRSAWKPMTASLVLYEDGTHEVYT